MARNKPSRKSADNSQVKSKGFGNAQNGIANTHVDGAQPVPTALRVGGAFLALALVLLLFGIISLLSDGWMVPFAVTWRFLLTSAAAGLAGAFVTTSVRYKGSKGQIVGLILALALIIAGRFASTEPLGYMAQYWLFIYAVGAFFCALLIRRSLIPRA